jgi:hypothetical protein
LASAAFFVLLVGAGAASADAPAPRAAVAIVLHANDAVINVGEQFVDTDIVEPEDDAFLAAVYDAATGEITDGDLTFPTYETHVTTPVDADVTVKLDNVQEITGTFDAATGKMELEARVRAQVTALGAICTVSTTPTKLTLSTDGDGAPFAGGLTGAGALAASWNDASASGSNILVCPMVSGEVSGPGDVWMEQIDGGGMVSPDPDPPGPGPGPAPGPGAGATPGPAPAAPPAARRKCSKKKKLKRGRCVKKKAKRPRKRR